MKINTVTVLGANGTMGSNVAGIFASFGRAKVYVVCRDIEKANKAKEKAFLSIKAESVNDNIIACTYNELEKCISESDFIFESLSENMSLKKDIYKMIIPYIKNDAIIATGTSGLSITELSKVFGDKSNNFLGVHMFNPPYMLTLCELVSHSENQSELVEELNHYMTSKLNRTVVQVKDSPSFLGNRIGFFFISEALKLAEINKEKGGISYIDSILGSYTGRSMAPLVTADFVGLDVTKSIIDYIFDNTQDSFNDSFLSTSYLNKLVSEGNYGKKVNGGLYHKNIETNKKYVLDLTDMEYKPVINYKFNFSDKMIESIRIGKYKEAINIMLSDSSKESNICITLLLKYIVYSIKVGYEVSKDIADIDDAMATGFSWIPPLALMELFGGKDRLKELVQVYLDEPFINIIKDESIMDLVPETSKYDYSSYLKGNY